MPIVANVFTRIWQFVDHRASGDDVTRSDLDIALDDLADGVQGALTAVDGVAVTAADAATAAAIAATAASLADSQADADAAAAAAVAAAASAATAQADLAAGIALQLDWKGPWVTTTVYAVSDLVQQSGNTYICLTAHTSGTFATDLAAVKWQLFASKGNAGVGTGDMLYNENLSGLTDLPAARANLGLGSAALSNFTPVQQGGGTGQGTNKVKIGWHTGGYGLKAMIDAYDAGYIVTNPSAGGGAATLMISPGAPYLFPNRAWGLVAANGALTAAGGVASTSKLGTGLYQVNFSIAMPDVNYAVVLGLEQSGRIHYYTKTTSGFRVVTYNGAGTQADGIFSFAVIR